MSAGTPLFTVPFEFGKSKGAFECKSLDQNIYLLSFSLPADNRLVAPFFKALITALDILEYKYPWGVVITTSSLPKFYSNGYDLEHIMETPRFMEDFCLPGLRRVLTFPMPTIACINGHTFGAGVFLAMAHDYRFMNPSKGFICLPEIELGFPIPSPIALMLQQKWPAKTYFVMSQEGIRVPGPKALEMGMLDGLGGLEECVKFALERKLAAKTGARIWGALKEDTYHATLDAFENYEGLVKWRDELERAKRTRLEKMKVELESWDSKLAKL